MGIFLAMQSPTTDGNPLECRILVTCLRLQLGLEAPQLTQRQVRTCGDGQSGNLLQELAVAQCAMPGRAVFLGQRAGERGRGDRDKAEQ